MKLKDIKGLKYIRESFKTRHFKYGGYAALITLGVFVGLILLNLVVGQLSPQIDMTESGLYSLTEQTIQVIDEIKSPVNFYGLWRPGEEIPQLPDIINLYLARSRHIRLEVLDPNRNPGFVAKYDRNNMGIASGSLIVEGEKGFKIITPSDMYEYMTTQSGQTSVTGLAMERRITSALLFVASGQTPVIYEIMGHQEYTMAELGLQSLIERENFSVRSLNLFQSQVPDDASTLILNSPRYDLTIEEAEKILGFLEKGGRLLVFADYRIGELENINEILSSYGMRYDLGIVSEYNYSYNVSGIPYYLYPNLLEHEITTPIIQQRTPFILPFGMGVSELAAKRRSVELLPLMVTSSNSILEQEDGTQTPGPIVLGMTATDPYWIDPNNPRPQTRIVVFGSGSFLEAVGQFPGNLDLFMNAVTWLENRPETLTVRSKSMFLLPMRISGLEMVIFGIIIVILIPVAFFIAGLIIWLKRRHL